MFSLCNIRLECITTIQMDVRHCHYSQSECFQLEGCFSVSGLKKCGIRNELRCCCEKRMWDWPVWSSRQLKGLPFVAKKSICQWPEWRHWQGTGVLKDPNIALASTCNGSPALVDGQGYMYSLTSSKSLHPILLSIREVTPVPGPRKQCASVHHSCHGSILVSWVLYLPCVCQTSFWVILQRSWGPSKLLSLLNKVS